MAFALIKEPYSPAVLRFYRSVYLRPPARTDTGITCPRWSAGNQADATPVAASGAVDPASAGVAGRRALRTEIDAQITFAILLLRQRSITRLLPGGILPRL